MPAAAKNSGVIGYFRELAAEVSPRALAETEVINDLSNAVSIFDEA